MFSWLELRTHCHATEDEEKVKKALKNLCPALEPSVANMNGYHRNPIQVLTVKTNKKKDIKAFWLLLGEQGLIPHVLDLLDDGIDDNGVLHLRFDKQKAHQGRFVLARHDDSIVVKIKIIRFSGNKGSHAALARESITELTQSDAPHT